MTREDWYLLASILVTLAFVVYVAWTPNPMMYYRVTQKNRRVLVGSILFGVSTVLLLLGLGVLG